MFLRASGSTTNSMKSMKEELQLAAGNLVVEENVVEEMILSN
jgi:hypothetical protein